MLRRAYNARRARPLASFQASAAVVRESGRLPDRVRARGRRRRARAAPARLGRARVPGILPAEWFTGSGQTCFEANRAITGAAGPRLFPVEVAAPAAGVCVLHLLEV